MTNQFMSVALFLLASCILGSSLARAQSAECSSSSEFAKYACVKAGDIAESNGQFALARKYWAIACKKGLRSACQSLKADPQGESQPQDSENSEEALAAAILSIERKYSDEGAEEELRVEKLVDSCQAGKIAEAKCLEEGKRLRSTKILLAMCDSENVAACFALGGIQLRGGAKLDAATAYLRGCSLGDEKSCSVLQRVQADLSIEEQKATRAEASERHRKDMQSREDEQDRQRQARGLEMMLKGAQKIGSGLAGSTSDDNLDSDLKREQLNSLKQQRKPSSFGNKRSCITKPALGGGLQSVCQDSY